MRRDDKGPATRWDYAILGLIIAIAMIVSQVIGLFLRWLFGWSA